MDNIKFKTIDEYISNFPKDIKKLLEEIRLVIKKSIPNCAESISYNMPAFKVNNTTIVYFAAYKNHIGFYPTPSPIEFFKKDLLKYKTSKGAIQFPINEPLPIDLIAKITKYRVIEVIKKD